MPDAALFAIPHFMRRSFLRRTLMAKVKRIGKLGSIHLTHQPLAVFGGLLHARIKFILCGMAHVGSLVDKAFCLTRRRAF